MLLSRSQNYARAMQKRLLVAAGLILIVAAALAAKQSAEQPSGSANTDGGPELSGIWKLNRDESEDPREKLRSAIRDHDQNGPMGGHGGMGGGGIGTGIPGIGVGGLGRPGGGMGRGPGAGSEDQRARLLALLEASDQLKVVHKGPEIDMTDTEGRVRCLLTDGRKIEKPKKDSPQMQLKARWERQTLITEEKGPSGEKISHAYELTSDGKQLADSLTLESKRLNAPIIVRSIYDRADWEKTE